MGELLRIGQEGPARLLQGCPVANCGLNAFTMAWVNHDGAEEWRPEARPEDDIAERATNNDRSSCVDDHLPWSGGDGIGRLKHVYDIGSRGTEC